MKEFKKLSGSDKAKRLQKYGIYTVICKPCHIKKDLLLIKKLKHLLGVSNIISINKQNNHINGNVKLYVKTTDAISWL